MTNSLYNLFKKKLFLPDFMGIGAQKAGTTWLHRNLVCHDDLFLPPEKELHYFDIHNYRDIEYYSSFFKEGKGLVKGEITPAYSILSRDVIEHIKQLMPDLKIIFVMRNPVYRTWSMTKYSLNNNNYNLSAVPDQIFYEYFNSEANRLRSDYLRTLDNWSNYFPVEQICILFYSDIKKDPRVFLKRVFKFLAISTEVDWSDFPLNKIYNESPNVEMPIRFKKYLYNFYRKDIEKLSKKFGSKTEAWMTEMEEVL